MRKSLLAALVVALVACGGDKSTGPQSVTGTYSLRTVNGGNPPAVVYQDAQAKLEVLDGTVTLAADNTWTGTLGARLTDFTTTPNQVLSKPGLALSGGTYTVTGGSITLNDPQDQLTFSGTVSNGSMSVSVDLIGLGQLTSLAYSK